MREDTLLRVSKRTEDTLKIHLCEDTRPGPNEEVYLHTKIHRGPNEDVYLEDTPEKMYNVVSLKRIVKCIFGYHSNFGQRFGPPRTGPTLVTRDDQVCRSKREAPALS